MITQENKSVIFEMLYRYYILHEDLAGIDHFLAILRKEIAVIEAADLTALNPEQFPATLKSEWQKFLHFRQDDQS